MIPLTLPEIADLHRRGDVHAIADADPIGPRAWLVSEANDFRLSAKLCGLGDHPEWVDAALQDVGEPLPKDLPGFALLLGGCVMGLELSRADLHRVIMDGAVDPGIIRLCLWLCAGYLSLDPARPKRGEGYPRRELALLTSQLWALLAEDLAPKEST